MTARDALDAVNAAWKVGRLIDDRLGGDRMNKHLWTTRLRGCMTKLTPTEYVVLTMLATYSNRAGDGARPAAGTLAADCGVSVKTVRRSLGTLVDKKYLTVTNPGGGRNRPTEYALVYDMPHLDEIHDDGDGLNVDTQSDHVNDDQNVDTQMTMFSEKRGHLKPETWSNQHLNVDTQMTTDQVDQERNHRGYVSRNVTSARANDPTTPPPEDQPITRGSLALVPDPTPDTDPDPEPADKCPRHRTRIGRIDEPCGPCREARLAHQAWTTRTAERAAAERAAAITARRTAITNCTRCDEYGWQLDDTGHAAEPARKCTHGDQPT